MTFLKITETYGDFWREAFDGWGWIVALYLVNLGFGALVIFFVIKTVNPKDPFPTAVVVAVGLLAYLATPIAAKPFVGEDLAGQPGNIRISELYAPWDALVSGEIDKRVRVKRSEEIEKVVAKYVNAGPPGKNLLLDRLNAGLAPLSKTAEEKAKIEEDVKTILSTKRGYRARLRDIASTL